MRIIKIMKNDIVDTDNGIAVSLWVAGCPHRCAGCHNPETWSFEAGTEIDRKEVLSLILEALDANGVQRNFSILGGEPLAPQNIKDVEWITCQIKGYKPDIKTYLWTGYNYENIQSEILKYVDVLIDGQFEQDKRDITLKLRGSSNQRIIDVQKSLENKQVILYCQ